jgi:hypothetical protein
MDIREKTYNLIEEQGGADYDEKKELAQALSEGDAKMLIQDLDRFYQGWFDVQQIKEYTEERARLEYIQETCFEVACEALALQGNPSVIPYFFKYLPLDDWDPKTEVNMEDYNTQNLEARITRIKYYGESYIPVLLAHIHELMPDKMIEARGFLWQMIWDDFNEFYEDQPLFSNLHLPKKQPFLKLLDYSMQCSLEEEQEEDPKQAESLLEQSSKILNDIGAESPHFLKLAYVRQQFLKLHAAD